MYTQTARKKEELLPTVEWVTPQEKGGFLTFQRWERKATVPEGQKPHEQGSRVLQGTVDCLLTLV